MPKYFIPIDDHNDCDDYKNDTNITATITAVVETVKQQNDYPNYLNYPNYHIIDKYIKTIFETVFNMINDCTDEIKSQIEKHNGKMLEYENEIIKNGKFTEQMKNDMYNEIISNSKFIKDTNDKINYCKTNISVNNIVNEYYVRQYNMNAHEFISGKKFEFVVNLHENVKFSENDIGTSFKNHIENNKDIFKLSKCGTKIKRLHITPPLKPFVISTVTSTIPSTIPSTMPSTLNRYFGYFCCNVKHRCKNGDVNEWKSGYAYSELKNDGECLYSQDCRICKKSIVPYKLTHLNGNVNINKKSTEPHIVDHCEICKKIKTDCSKLTEKEINDLLCGFLA